MSTDEILDPFINDSMVIKSINDTNKFIVEGSIKFSNTTDHEGNYYVDLVQEGGGVLGYGLLGFIYALEECNIRFYNIGGTSAGAINSLFLAAADSPDKPKAKLILRKILEKDIMDFVDGGKDAKSLVEKLSKDTEMSSFSKVLTALSFFDDFVLRKEKGINRGHNFHEWLCEVLKDFDIYSMEDLRTLMNDFPISIDYGSTEIKDKQAKLAIIASDITTQTKAVFPKHAHLYFSKPDKVNPADFVRASMSIPLFFDPYIINDIPKGKDQVLRWQELENAYYFGNIPDQVMFVDGGVMSNFPIDIFHTKEHRLPSRPTFGVKLGIDRVKSNTIESVVDILTKSFSSSSQTRDLDVILKNEDYRMLISSIEVSNINWLNFKLSVEQKTELFRNGVVAATSFLKEFNWEAYLKVRDAKLGKEQKEKVVSLDKDPFYRAFLQFNK